MLLGTFGCQVGEHGAPVGLDHEAMAKNVGYFAGNGSGVMIGHLEFLDFQVWVRRRT
jgi:hypothetical protein